MGSLMVRFVLSPTSILLEFDGISPIGVYDGFSALPCERGKVLQEDSRPGRMTRENPLDDTKPKQLLYSKQCLEDISSNYNTANKPPRNAKQNSATQKTPALRSLPLNAILHGPVPIV